MPIPFTPYVPDFITVHLGNPDSYAENVTVSFPNYIKNVASSEIYPTWNEEAIYANIYAQISYALNRVYTEYYRSRGYDFDITSTTAFDQKFINGRNIFENIDRIVDDIFTTYIRRQGNLEPLAAKFCNGTTTTCDGLSQWGSQELAVQGMNSLDILKYYYGNNIELVEDAPIAGVTSVYPGFPVRRGDRGATVTVIQEYLNAVSDDYPLIPEINPVDGIFGENTENAVVTFQQIFNLTPDGIVGRATWNKLVYLYVAVKRLSELDSEGQQLIGAPLEFTGDLTPGVTGTKVSNLQYFLDVIAFFDSRISDLRVTAQYDTQTQNAVRQYQSAYGLPVTGVVNSATWDSIYNTYSAIINVVLRENIQSRNQLQPEQFRGYDISLNDTDFSV